MFITFFSHLSLSRKHMYFFHCKSCQFLQVLDQWIEDGWASICMKWLCLCLCILDDVYVRKESERQLERRNQEEEECWLIIMPAGVSWTRYLTFFAACLASALAGSQMVHLYCKPSLVSFYFSVKFVQFQKKGHLKFQKGGES